MKKKGKTIVNKTDWCYVIPKLLFVVPVLLVVLIGVGWSVLSKEPLDPYYPVLTYSLVAIWLVTEALDIIRSKFSNPIKAAVEQGISDALPQIGYLISETGRENILAALRVEVLEIVERIDAISWKELSQRLQDPVASTHFSTIEERLVDRSKPKAILRRLLWKPEHLDAIEAWAKIYDLIPNSEFKYYESSQDEETSLLPCLILDKKTVHFGFGYLGTPNVDDIDITVKAPEVVDAFNKYFTYLWTNAANARYVKRINTPVDMQAISQLRIRTQKGGKK